MEWQQVSALIGAHIDGDEERFRAVGLQIVANERAAKHIHAANAIEVALHRKPSTINRAVALARAGAPPFIKVVTPHEGLESVILHEACAARIQSILREHADREALERHGLRPSGRLLFHGPPGNGKTRCAGAVAHALGLPLLKVRVDGLIESFLGATNANVRKVFDFAENVPGVLFFDEFDALVRPRDAAAHDVGEMSRVVNSFLQILDEFDGSYPIVVATNLPQLIDRAVRRRFDEVVAFDRPTAAMAETLIRRVLGPTAGDLPAIPDVSMAAMERAARKARKATVLGGARVVERALLESCLGEAVAAERESA